MQSGSFLPKPVTLHYRIACYTRPHAQCSQRTKWELTLQQMSFMRQQSWWVENCVCSCLSGDGQCPLPPPPPTSPTTYTHTHTHTHTHTLFAVTLTLTSVETVPFQPFSCKLEQSRSCTKYHSKKSSTPWLDGSAAKTKRAAYAGENLLLNLIYRRQHPESVSCFLNVQIRWWYPEMFPAS